MLQARTRNLDAQIKEMTSQSILVVYFSADANAPASKLFWSLCPARYQEKEKLDDKKAIPNANIMRT